MIEKTVKYDFNGALIGGNLISHLREYLEQEKFKVIDAGRGHCEIIDQESGEAYTMSALTGHSFSLDSDHLKPALPPHKR